MMQGTWLTERPDGCSDSQLRDSAGFPFQNMVTGLHPGFASHSTFWAANTSQFRRMSLFGFYNNDVPDLHLL